MTCINPLYVPKVIGTAAAFSLLFIVRPEPVLASGDFLPHAVCYLWDRSLLAVHAVSDVLIGLSYVAISLSLVYFVRQRRDLPFPWIFLAFGVFIVACGATHFMEVWTLWHSDYWMAGGVKVLTAFASVVTALLLPPLIPRAIRLPSPHSLERANEELGKQVAERHRAEEALRGAHAELSGRLRVTEGLLAVAQHLAGSLEVPELARRAVRELTLLIGADTSIFFSAADESGFSHAVAGYHVPEQLRQADYRMSMIDLPPYIVESLRTHEPLASSDVASDARFEHPAIRMMPIQPKSILYTPVLSKGAIRGAILSYWWHAYHQFTADEARLSAGVANQLALALENAGLYAQSERRRRASAALAETSRLLAQAQGVETVAQRVVESVRSLIGGTVAILYRFDPASGAFVSMAVSGDPGVGPGTRFSVPPGVGAIALAARGRAPVATPDLTQDSRIVLSDYLAQQFLYVSDRAALAVPLLLHDDVIGALMLRDHSGRVFRPEEIDVARSFADHAVVALENARLHEQQVMLAHEDERRRITYDLHDGIAQLVVGAKQRFDTCHDFWAVDPKRAQQEFETGVKHLGRTIIEMRRVLRALRPLPLDSIGLAGAIGENLKEVAREAGWKVDLSENLGFMRFSPTAETAVFRIAQEALANARRHARASQVNVRLHQSPDWLELDVWDDGVGAEAIGRPAVESRGLGLLSMRERATALGGTCTVTSEPGRGTKISARIPLKGRVST
jgi:signal transduction histidine kinase